LVGFFFVVVVIVVVVVLQYWGNLAQDLAHTGQALNHQSYKPSLLYSCFVFETGSHCHCPDWPQTADPPVSTSPVVGITDVYYHTQGLPLRFPSYMPVRVILLLCFCDGMYLFDWAVLIETIHDPVAQRGKTDACIRRVLYAMGHFETCKYTVRI
jgi:hypothetical protein